MFRWQHDAAMVVGAVLLAGGLRAAEAAGSVRHQLSERLRAEHPYQPASDRPGRELEGEPVLELEPFVVTGQKDKSAEFGRILREQRQAARLRRPSLEGGASIDTHRAMLGPRPYRELLEEDARFKTSKAITPTWNLLELKF